MFSNRMKDWPCRSSFRSSSRDAACNTARHCLTLGKRDYIHQYKVLFFSPICAAYTLISGRDCKIPWFTIICLMKGAVHLWTNPIIPYIKIMPPYCWSYSYIMLHLRYNITYIYIHNPQPVYILHGLTMFSQLNSLVFMATHSSTLGDDSNATLVRTSSNASRIISRRTWLSTVDDRS